MAGKLLSFYLRLHLISVNLRIGRLLKQAILPTAISETQDFDISRNRSFTTSKFLKTSKLNMPCNSDINCYIKDTKHQPNIEFTINTAKTILHTAKENRNKLDDGIVKEKGDSQSITESKDDILITNSHLERLECTYKDITQELQADESCTHIDSCIKFFKMTVEDIFDNFFTSMETFEYFKTKFNEIIAKSKGEAIADVEDLINDIIQHIISSETSLAIDENTTENTGRITTRRADSEKLLLKLNSIVGNLKIQNLTQFATVKGYCGKEKHFFPYRDSPCVQMNTNNKSFLSEVNIEYKGNNLKKSRFASAGDLKNIDLDEMESLEQKIENSNMQFNDREIPVKVSNARKNIHMDDETISEERDPNNKSFISKICHFLCKRFRKN